MIEEYSIEKRVELIPIFEKHRYLYTIAEGLLKEKRGEAYVDALTNTKVAVIGNGIYFLAGDENSSSVPALLDKILERRLFLIENEKWLSKIEEHWGDKLKPYPRTKFSSEGLSIKVMKEIQKNLPDGLRIEKLTKKTVNRISDQAKRIVGLLFGSIEEFYKRNFGFCILDDEKIVSLALAASPIYENKFEIHIETDPEYQRKGLAMISSAALIQYSLENGLEPHWDADNEPSAKLALKLGFTKPEKYNAYIWMELEKD